MIYNESEDAFYIQHGADSVRKKLGNSTFQKLYETSQKTSYNGSYVFENSYNQVLAVINALGDDTTAKISCSIKGRTLNKVFEASSVITSNNYTMLTKVYVINDVRRGDTINFGVDIRGNISLFGI